MEWTKSSHINSYAFNIRKQYGSSPPEENVISDNKLLVRNTKIAHLPSVKKNNDTDYKQINNGVKYNRIVL